MNKKMAACFACGLALTAVLATGCIPVQTQQASSTPTPARTYITSVHQVYTNMNAQMEGLTAAVVSGDTAALIASLDKMDVQVAALGQLEVPAGLEKLQEAYVDATKSLAKSVRSYADYRLNGGSSGADAAAQLAAIQADYNAGIKALKDADEIAKAL